jgi:drug/metabolite transporter (DMT)-like permease
MTDPLLSSSSSKEKRTSSNKNSFTNKNFEKELKTKNVIIKTPPSPQKVDDFKIENELKLEENSNSWLEKKKYPFYIWIVIIVALINSGFLGPFLMIVEANEIVKAGWRQLMTAILIIPIAVYEKFITDKELYKFEVLFNKAVVNKLIIAAFFHSIWIISFAYSINYTSMTQVYILNNMDVFIYCFFKMIKREKISGYEKFGFSLTIIGVILIYINTDILFFTKDTPDYALIAKGNTIALLGSIAAALYLSSCHGITEEYPSWLGLTLINILSAINQLLFALIFYSATFDTDEFSGIFGVFTKRWFLTHIGISFLTGIGCYCLLIIISQKLSPLHYNFILNLEPLSGALMTFFFGLENLPGILTWIAMIIIIISLTTISLGRAQSDIQDIDFDDIYFNDSIYYKDKNSFAKKTSGVLLGRESNIEFKLFNSKRNKNSI